MIRIVAVLDTTRVSGPARQLAAVCAPLAQLGIEQHILAMQPEHTPKTSLLEFLDDQCVPHSAFRVSGRLRPDSVCRLSAAIAQLSPDILQTHSYRPNAHVLALRALDRINMPWIAFHHGVTSENWRAKLYHAIDRLMLHCADEVVVVAERQPSHTPGAMLRIVGDGPARRLLEQHPAVRSDEGSISFVGLANPPWPHFAAASVVVLPSRSEGAPNVLLEAICLDKPVVATDVGGIAHVLGSPPAGLLVPSEQPDALARGVCDVLSGEHEALHSGERARVRETSTVQERARALATVYRAVHERLTY